MTQCGSKHVALSHETQSVVVVLVDEPIRYSLQPTTGNWNSKAGGGFTCPSPAGSKRPNDDESE